MAMIRVLNPAEAAPRRARPGPQPRSGAAAVEFVLVVPILVLIVLGTIDLGRTIMVLDLLNHAARVGCRIGVLPGNGTTEITNGVNAALAGAGISGANEPAIDVQPRGSGTWVSPGDAGAATTGDAIRVTVSVAYKKVTWLAFTSFVGSDTNLSSTVVMCKE
jgi:Flp pilus assembly protein TadG